MKPSYAIEPTDNGFIVSTAVRLNGQWETRFLNANTIQDATNLIISDFEEADSKKILHLNFKGETK